MPLQRVQFKAGVNRDQTNYANEGGWFECDKVRFRSGYPQKIGGWFRYGIFVLLGACRSMFNWVTSYGDNIMAYGTHKKIYLEVGRLLFDITPIREQDSTYVSPETDDCFTVTYGSRVVLVTIPLHLASTGDFVTFSGAVGAPTPGALGGIPIGEINANHEVTVLTANTFTITVQTPAIFGEAWNVGTWGTGAWGVGGSPNTLVGGGDDITAEFEIAIGNPITIYGYGWSVGPWSSGAWGQSSGEPVNIQQRNWFFQNFDNDLVANIRNGPIYYWERGINVNPNSALNTRAILLSDLPGATDVPLQATQIIVSQNDKHLICLGSTAFGSAEFDPLLIRWANQDDPTNWTPEVTNSAGFIRVSRGSEIVCGVATRQEILVFTQATLNSLQFLGTTDVFGLQEMADNISIISPQAVQVVNNTVYWMGKDKFYAYSGRVDTLPTTLRNHVFNNINLNQVDQIISGTNEAWNEIWWMYPTADSNYNNAYVIYNFVEQAWYYGTISRTAWLDTPLRTYGQAVETDPTNWTGIVYNQEQGTNDGVLPMESYITSSDFDIGDGEQFVLMNRIIPDVNFDGSTAAAPEVTMTIKPRNFPGSAYITNMGTESQPVIVNTPPNQRVINTTITQYTPQVFIRARARQLGFEIRSTDLNVQWQLGAPRIDGRPDGKR
jgi:hypothetical protein